MPKKLDKPARRRRADKSIVPNEETIKPIEEAHRGGLKNFATVADLMADLNDEKSK
jgi:hypothetical protein